jgi:hypothetical protein
MADRSRYQRLEALYRRGKVLEFPDGTLMWIQVMNPLEADDVREEAKTAKARLVLALREVGSDEQAKALYDFSLLPKASAVDQIVQSQQTRWLAQADEKLRDDPEWKERLEILDRNQALAGRVPEASERELLQRITEDYLREVYRRVGEDADFERERLMQGDEAEVRERWLELYREHRGDEAAFKEHQTSAAWIGARVCDATPAGEGRWDHSACDHDLRVYEAKLDFRKAPLEVQGKILEALGDLNISLRDAKNSDSAETSSDSSALQDPPEESTPSTPTETHSEPPGSSTQPSSTP